MDNEVKERIYAIPSSIAERERLRRLIASLMEHRPLTPPLSMHALSELSEQLIADHDLDAEIKGWLMVEFNNCAWRDTVAAIPPEKRILLLPQCLKDSTACEGEIDELGLLCHRCGRCSITGLQELADSLGMMNLVAEGFTAVAGLVESGVVDTVIGVSCLDSLEKAFPLLIDNAIPGLAIPLNMAGCKDTTVDAAYVNRMIQMRSEKEIKLLDYDKLNAAVKDCFRKDNLSRLIPPSSDHTSAVAAEWLGGEGKRWRPYLLAAVYQAISGNADMPENVQRAAVSVECFHKASLVHDDIQDNDFLRYDKPTVHAVHGTPIAINVGDILLGEGYRLLTDCGNMELLKVAAEAHIALCKGQGMELEWCRQPRPLTMDFVLDIFCNKTVPAFDVALIMGVKCAGGDEETCNTLHDYARALGIAYQLLDDIEDFATADPLALRPSSVLAMLCERYPNRKFILEMLKAADVKEYLNRADNKPFLDEALHQVRKMAKQYHRQALDALHDNTNVELKRLLFRVTKRILK